jgi:uncharacterized membrane protein YbhN (UPF0104 family)
LIETATDSWGQAIQILGLTVVLVGIHPRILNPVMHFLSRFQGNGAETETVELKQYPWLPLGGELGFLLLRGLGFLLAWMALTSLNLSQVPTLLSAFSFAWLLGMIVPGAPGGMGVFEATVIALLDKQQFPPGILLSTVAIFRLISILAEVVAAGVAWLGKNYEYKL